MGCGYMRFFLFEERLPTILYFVAAPRQWKALKQYFFPQLFSLKLLFGGSFVVSFAMLVCLLMRSGLNEVTLYKAKGVRM